MGRALLDAVGLFALPFVLYAVALLLRRRLALVGPAWTRGRFAWLVAAGLGCVLAGLVLLGTLAPRPRGAYTPAHLENGQLVPGEIR